MYLRAGFEMPFTNFTFDIVPPADLARKKVIIGGKEQNQTYGQFRKEMEMINKAFWKSCWKVMIWAGFLLFHTDLQFNKRF